MTEIKNLIYPQPNGDDVVVEFADKEIAIRSHGVVIVVTTKAVGALEQLYNQLRVCDVEVVHE